MKLEHHQGILEAVEIEDDVVSGASSLRRQLVWLSRFSRPPGSFQRLSHTSWQAKRREVSFFVL